MKIVLESHADIEIVDPAITIKSTLDLPLEEVFIPEIELACANCRVIHTLPPQQYVNGTWTDEDVIAAVNSYLESINQE